MGNLGEVATCPLLSGQVVTFNCFLFLKESSTTNTCRKPTEKAESTPVHVGASLSQLRLAPFQHRSPVRHLEQIDREVERDWNVFPHVENDAPRLQRQALQGRRQKRHEGWIGIRDPMATLQPPTLQGLRQRCKGQMPPAAQRADIFCLQRQKAINFFLKNHPGSCVISISQSAL